MDLLRFSTAGSVDDGKSTLIGRLLYDSGGAYDDQIASISKSGDLDLSQLTDGLRAEREQGITIDVAYRYFATPRRKFIIADTPGHEQYTRNMATGASTASLTIVLIDARKGVLPQSRRHAFIASLLGIPRVAVAVNKMDLVDFSREAFQAIERDFTIFARDLGFREIRFFPLSALKGDNVVRASHRTPWFDGGSLLEYLETAPVSDDRDERPFRLPVQNVVRPNLTFRGYAGQVASGSVRPGDAVRILPSGRITTVQSLDALGGDPLEAFAPMSITLTLAGEFDISRGDMLVAPNAAPTMARRFNAHLVWMSEQPLRVGRAYILKHTTRQIRARVIAIEHKIDINTLAPLAATELALNEIAVATLETQHPLYFDAYRENRITGSFILIDTASNATVAAGMIIGGVSEPSSGRVTEAERRARNGHRPALVRVSDLETAHALERALFDRGAQVVIAASQSEAETLERAGLIAIVTAPGESPRSLDDVVSSLLD
jgi:sulfate adenylyltransferase large subunit